MESSMDKQAVVVSEADVICRLCSKSFSSPKLVACLHTYCQQCIQNNLTEKNTISVFKCLQCMHETQLREASASTLVDDLHVIALQEIFNCHTAKAANCVVCSLKGVTSDATHCCLDCDDSLCEICSTGHNSSSATASHRVVYLDDLRRGKYDQDILKRKNVTCGNHTEEICRVFCHTCSEPTCVHCVLSVHKDHVYESIEDAVAKKRSALTEALESAVNSPNPVGNLQSAELELEQLNIEEAMFIQNITETTSFIIETIRHQSLAVLEEGRQSFAEERKRREKTKTKAEAEYPRRENILKVCHRMAVSPGLDLLAMEPAVRNGLLLLSNTSSVREHPLATFKAVYDVSLENNLVELQQVTFSDSVQASGKKPKTAKSTADNPNFEIEDNASTNGSSTSSCLEIIDHGETAANVQSLSSQNSLKSKQIKKLKCKGRFSTKVGTDHTVPDISAMAFGTGYGTCLCLDKNNGKLKIYKLNGDMAFLVDMNGKCDLFTQFVHVDNGNICAVYENYLLVLSKHLKLESKISLIPKDAMKATPVLANFADNIIVGNLPDNEMRVFSTSGKVLRSWTRPIGCKIVSMNYAGKDKVITTTWSRKGSVNIESEKRGLLLKLESQKRKDFTWRPVCAVVDQRGHILVTDTRRNEISVFSPTGDLVCLVDTIAKNISQPNCLIVDNSDNVYVSFEDGKVAVYGIKY